MKLLVLAIVGLAALSLGGCAASTSSDKPTSTPTPTPSTFSAIGTIQVPMNFSATLPLQNGKPTIGNPCVPQSGYNDISTGAQVVISNASGEKIALGSLESGTLANGPGGEAFIQSVCQFAFTVDDVPDEGKIYSVHIGNDNRGEQSFTQNDLRVGVSLTLG